MSFLINLQELLDWICSFWKIIKKKKKKRIRAEGIKYFSLPRWYSDSASFGPSWFNQKYWYSFYIYSLNQPIMTYKVIFSLLLLFQSILAFSQEGYRPGETIPLYYNKIFSLKNPLTYSIQSLPFICPTSSPRKKSLLVYDQDLRGDRLTQSNYKVIAGCNKGFSLVYSSVLD